MNDTTFKWLDLSYSYALAAKAVARDEIGKYYALAPSVYILRHSVELLVKGIMCSFGIRFSKIHDLTTLLGQAHLHDWILTEVQKQNIERCLSEDNFKIPADFVLSTITTTLDELCTRYTDYKSIISNNGHTEEEKNDQKNMFFRYPEEGYSSNDLTQQQVDEILQKVAQDAENIVMIFGTLFLFFSVNSAGKPLVEEFDPLSGSKK